MLITHLYSPTPLSRAVALFVSTLASLLVAAFVHARTPFARVTPLLGHLCWLPALPTAFGGLLADPLAEKAPAHWTLPLYGLLVFAALVVPVTLARDAADAARFACGGGASYSYEDTTTCVPVDDTDANAKSKEI